MQIDHVIYAAPDLAAAVADVEQRFGVRAAGGGQHLGYGTHNRLLSLGPSSYLEIIAPDPGQPEPDAPRPFGVHGVTRPAVVGWAVSCDDIYSASATMRAAGHDPGDVLAFQRVTSDGGVLRWQLTANALTAGAMPFLICWGDTQHPAASAPGGLSLTSLQIDHPRPDAVNAVLRALGVAVEVTWAQEIALVAHLLGPTGPKELP